ncbi:MAG: YbgA family protein [bacterium]
MRRPVILISRCIEFDNCRYNGQGVKSPLVKKLKEFCDFTTVCPEVSINLGIPRNPIRIIKSKAGEILIQPSTGDILTDKMETFSKKFLREIENIDGIILKGRSPSCGIKDVKIFSEKGIELSRKHAGFFGREVVEKYSGYPMEDEGRLMDERLREHFLIKLYAFAGFREARDEKNITGLLKYHEYNKLLFMAYNQKEMRIIGNLLGNQKKFTKNELFDSYFESLKRITERPITKGNDENTLLHAFGYVSKNMKKKEIEFFLKTLHNYREGAVSVTVLKSLMKSFIVRFEVAYLEKQTYFNPYPAGL